VAWICTEAPGSPDRDVLARAVKQSRILLTFDKDFGELALHEGLPAICGIVLFRLPMPASSEVGRFIINILNSRSDWIGHFSVIEPGRLRMRPLPPAAK
jgi:predicted nuclease of predicted toxin-antitoxin system